MLPEPLAKVKPFLHSTSRKRLPSSYIKAGDAVFLESTDVINSQSSLHDRISEEGNVPLSQVIVSEE